MTPYTDEDYRRMRQERMWMLRDMGWLRKLKVRLGFGSVTDVCLMSVGETDYHDYKKSKGGDGIPTHFHTYTCWNCGKKFTI